MTNENMIKQLKRLIPSLKYADDVNAVKGAIKALSQGPRYWIGEDGIVHKLVTMELVPDAVSRDAVKEIINDIRDCISVEGYCAILERLKKLPSFNPQEPGKWIPVSEDLPEYTINDKVSEDVLVFDGTDIRVGEYRKGIHLHGAGYWRVFGYEIDEHVDVKAWMPLPKPYDPQKSKDK